MTDSIDDIVNDIIQIALNLISLELVKNIVCVGQNVK